MMSPSSNFLPLSSLPRSTSQIDPALTQEQSPPRLRPPPPLPSSQDDPSFSTAPEEPSQPTATSPTSPTNLAVSAEAEVSEEAPPSDIPPPPPPPPNFAPFFSLLSSSHPTSTDQSTTTYHPAVHYIFADDPPDTSPIVDAALDVLDSSAGKEGAYREGAGGGGHGGEADGETEAEEEGTTGLASGGGTKRRKERYILLEMDESGTKVRSAKSMSPDWAVAGAEMSMAPTWEGDGAGAGAGGVGSEAERGGGGWMLRVEGVEALGGGATHGEKGTQVTQGKEKGLEELVLEYEQRIGELRRVVGLGGTEAKP